MEIKLDMLGITVSDMAESIRFYRLLGINVDDPVAGEPYHEATLPNGLRISWNDLSMVKDHDPEWCQPEGQRLGMAFLCDTPDAVDATFAKVLAAGFHSKRSPWNAFWGQRYAQVVDPDGNIVDLFAWLPS